MLIYRKAGIGTQRVFDDSGSVNVHGLAPPIWVKLGMLFLNLVVWVSAALRLAG